MRQIYPATSLRRIILAVFVTALGFLAGCAGTSGTATPSAMALPQVSGSLHGGQAPIVGSHVFIYEMSTSGYKAASRNMDSTEPGFVTTDGGGNFTFNGIELDACTSPNSQLYFVGMGGNPGLKDGTDNSAAVLMAALGPCSGVNASTFANVNEVSTIAAVTVLQPFMADATHIGASSIAQAQLGLANAVASIFNLIDSPSGNALAVTPVGNGVVPQAEINTLANIMATCVNSDSPDSSGCVALFTGATPPADSGPAPTDALAAVLNIARYPDSNVNALYALSSAFSPFQPSINTANGPNDFSIGITYSIPTGTLPQLQQPGQIVIDSLGNVWTANCQSCIVPAQPDYLAKFGPNGTFVNNFNVAGVHATKGLAIDSLDNVWSANTGIDAVSTVDQVTKIDSSGTIFSGFPISEGLDSPVGIAVDANDQAWVSSSGGGTPGGTTAGSVNLYSPSGAELVNYDAADNGFAFPIGIAIDRNGNTFVAGIQGDVLELGPTGQEVNTSAMGVLQSSPSAPNEGIAIAAGNFIWAVDQINEGIQTLSTGASTQSVNDNIAAGIFQASVPAIDGAGIVWIANCKAGCAGSGSTDPDNIIGFNPDGSLYNGHNGFNGYQVAGFNGVATVAVDASGNLWISNSNVNGSAATATITQLIGAATPTVTPLAVAATGATLLDLP